MCQSFLGAEKFNIPSDQKMLIQLFDQESTAIKKEDFETIVRNFHRSGSFHIRLEVHVKETVITPSVSCCLRLCWYNKNCWYCEYVIQKINNNNNIFRASKLL